MSVFDGIEHVAAEGTSLRQYFEPGNYVVQIDSVFIHERRLGAGKLFIVETTVIESNNPNIKPGDKRNWVQSLTLPTALPRIKAFIGAAMGFCTKKQTKEIDAYITKEMCEQIIGPKNPLHGKSLFLNCINKITKAGKNFTQVIWENK